MSRNPKRATKNSRQKFDEHFGLNVLDSIPREPGIYRFYDSDGTVVYVGKAKNLYRRLAQYRNAKRVRRHKKMRTVVESSVRFDFETCASEREALLLENRWIRELRPKWNVAGAFYFLYPLLAVREREGGLDWVYTTEPQSWKDQAEINLFGAFRSRSRTREAYFALHELLRIYGHRSESQEKEKERFKYSVMRSYRQIPLDWIQELKRFLHGESFQAIESLSIALLDRPTARARAGEIQENLRILRRFWKFEILPLRRALELTGAQESSISQAKRDELMILASGVGL